MLIRAIGRIERFGLEVTVRTNESIAPTTETYRHAPTGRPLDHLRRAWISRATSPGPAATGQPARA